MILMVLQSGYTTKKDTSYSTERRQRLVADREARITLNEPLEEFHETAKYIVHEFGIDILPKLDTATKQHICDQVAQKAIHDHQELYDQKGLYAKSVDSALDQLRHVGASWVDSREARIARSDPLTEFHAIANFLVKEHGVEIRPKTMGFTKQHPIDMVADIAIESQQERYNAKNSTYKFHVDRAIDKLVKIYPTATGVYTRKPTNL